MNRNWHFLGRTGKERSSEKWQEKHQLINSWREVTVTVLRQEVKVVIRVSDV